MSQNEDSKSKSMTELQTVRVSVCIIHILKALKTSDYIYYINFNIIS